MQMVDDAEKAANIWTVDGEEVEIHHRRSKQNGSGKGVETTKSKWLSK